MPIRRIQTDRSTWKAFFVPHENLWWIYRIVAEGKSYIGATSNLNQRKGAWKHERPDWFDNGATFEPIATTWSKELASELEDYFVSVFQSDGWNKRGGGFAGYQHSDETKQRIAEKAIGRPGSCRGRKKSPEEIEKHRASLKRYYETHPGTLKGKPVSDETRRRMSAAAKVRASLSDRKSDGTFA